MPQSSKLKAALVVAGVAGLASMAPLSASHADELLRLDDTQMDAVSAGALAGFTLLGESGANGSLRSFSRTDFNGVSTSSPVASVATGTVVNTAIATGGDAPTVNTQSSLVDFAGTPILILPIVIEQAGPGFAFSVNALAVAFVDTEVPVF